VRPDTVPPDGAHSPPDPAPAEGAGVSRRVVVALHAGYWGVYAALLLALLTLLQARPGAARDPLGLARVVAVPLTVPNVAAFYASHAWLFPLVRDRRGWPALLGAGALVCGGAALVGFWLLHARAGAPPLPRAQWPALAALAACLFALAALHGALAVGMRGFLAWYAELRTREARERRAHALELDLLRSRLDPHFLFNTLHNIDVLIEQDPSVASAYLHRLSGLMRYVLFEAAAPRVPLAVELDHMARYLEVEALRHADPAYASLEIAGDAAGVTVPPTLFMPFVENAFKHADRARAAGQVRVCCEVGAGTVTFRCVNRCRPDANGAAPPTDARRGAGLGQALVRRRLELLYPGRHVLEVRRADGEYDVRLTLHALEAPGA
jgi:two-component system, LytTR family, sensor kinase